MNPSQREQMIDRYLAGMMTPEEEEEFFLQIALDEEMRRMLRAHQIIDSALRKDRDASTRELWNIRSSVESLSFTTAPADLVPLPLLIEDEPHEPTPEPVVSSPSLHWRIAAIAVLVLIALLLIASRLIG